MTSLTSKKYFKTTHFVSYLEKEKCMALKLSIDRVLKRHIFVEKLFRKCTPKYRPV